MDGEAKMSLSKIIKATETTDEIVDFNFNAIARGAPVAGQQAGGFVPLELFDLSELADKNELAAGFANQVADNDDQEKPELPPGKFVTDEEFQRSQDEAYQRGLQDGKKVAEQGLQHLFKTLRTAVEDLQELRAKVLRESEDHLLALTMTIASTVVQREVQQDDETVIRLVRAAIGTLNKQDELILRVNPADYTLLTSSHAEMFQREMGTILFELKPDPAVTAGGCLIENRLGTVDASIEAQLAEFYRALLEEHARQNNGTGQGL